MTKDQLIAKLAEYGIEANKSATKAELEEKLGDVTAQAAKTGPDTTTGEAVEEVGVSDDPRIETGAQALHKAANPNGKPWHTTQTAVKERFREYTTAVLEAIDNLD